MAFDGNLAIERAPARRWVPAVAVALPVAAFVLAAAWFIRAFVAPPMAEIPAPMVLAAVPPQQRAPAETPVQPPAPAMPTAVAEAPPPASPAPIDPTPAPPMPAFASLSAAPPMPQPAMPQPAVPHPAVQPSAFADPTPDTTAAVQPATQALEPAAPIAGPIPMPPQRPRIAVALVAGDVPLPRARPAVASPAPETSVSDAPSVYRHSVE